MNNILRVAHQLLIVEIEKYECRKHQSHITITDRSPIIFSPFSPEKNDS